MGKKQADRGPGDRKPLWKRTLLPAVFIGIGIVIAFPLFSITYYTMVRTSTPQFLRLLPRNPVCLQHLEDLHPCQQRPGLCGRLHGLPSSRPPRHLRLFLSPRPPTASRTSSIHFTEDKPTTTKRTGEAAYAVLQERTVPEMPPEHSLHPRKARGHAGPPGRPLSPAGI